MELDDHTRSIIHIDIDCFYAQVEILKQPHLKDQPLGVRQKNIVVTSNYIAREYGLKKCMLVEEAKKLCPSLILVNGEDLHDYRQTSYKVTNLLQNYTNLVERQGLDENFIDVTELVKERLINHQFNKVNVEGNIFGDSSDNEKCECGCVQRLTLGTIIAKEIRDDIYKKLNLTTCAGVAHNKLLAKIVCSQFKPNQQTVIFPNSTLELLLNLKSLRKIPGIGKVLMEQLEVLNIKTIEDVHNCDYEKLRKTLGDDKAKLVYNLSHGIDNNLVKTSGKPQIIGLEDSCRTISFEKEVKEKLEHLLTRLLQLVNEDGRIPKTIKLTVRKFDKIKNISHRETRQCNVNLTKSHGREAKIMTTIMHLFNKLVDINKPFHITLLGLAFTKFQDTPKNSLDSFFRQSLEVQSLTSIESNNCNSPMQMSPIPTTSNINNSPSPSSPSSKKLKLETSSLAKRKCFENFEDSPSKLKVGDLCLTSEDINCPPTIDNNVFKELPKDMQKELWEDYKRDRKLNFCVNQMKKTKPNTLLNYFIRNT